VGTMPDHRKSAQHSRLKDALRENLKRRKAQARGRAETLRADDGEEHNSADRDATDTKSKT
jgi:hypothetical protein